MSLSVNFSVAQVSGEPGQIVFTDLTTGTDGAVVARRIYLRNSDGQLEVPEGTSTEYVLWDNFPGTTTITVDLPLEAKAYTITVEWVNSGGTSLYDKTLVREFTLYLEEFDYQLRQLMASNPLLTNDNDFFKNKSLLRTLIDSGNNAITQAGDTYNAQLCYDQATELMNTSQYSFNGNS